MKIKSLFISVLCLLCVSVTAYSQDQQSNTIVNKNAKVALETTMGTIVVKLYDDTPKHRDNFLKLVNDGVYNGVLFHRVIKNFMIQGGDPSSKTANPGQALGEGDLDYTVEAEFVYPKHFHKYGALAAARTGDEVNPERRSSASQFYIVTGNVYSNQSLGMMAMQKENQMKQDIFNAHVKENLDSIRSMQMKGDSLGLENLQKDLVALTEAEYEMHPFSFTPEQKRTYTTKGGTPHLDGQYTVYGEVVEGMDVVEKIQNVETGPMDRPKEDVKIVSAKILEE